MIKQMKVVSHIDHTLFSSIKEAFGKKIIASMMSSKTLILRTTHLDHDDLETMVELMQEHGYDLIDTKTLRDSLGSSGFVWHCADEQESLWVQGGYPQLDDTLDLMITYDKSKVGRPIKLEK